MKRTVLCLHQSAELYGSDRSFLSTVQGIVESNDVDIVLPFNGELYPLLEECCGSVSVYSKGILRKKEVKKPLRYLKDTILSVFHYVNEYKKYDIVYINTVVMLSALLAAVFFRFSSKKIICHVREIPSNKQILFFKAIFKLGNINLIYNSNATKHAFNLPGLVIYNGVEDIGNNNIIERNTSGEEIRFLVIGRINTWKGQQLFIDALYEYAKKSRHKISARIVGSPFEGYEYLKDELEKRIVELGLQDTVSLIPFTNFPNEHYLWTDYIVVPSIKPEPFGRVVVEAFSAGKPAIAANHGGLSEIVINQHDGYLFQPNNKEDLISVFNKIDITHDEKYLIMSTNARKNYENKFSVRTYQDEIKKAIEE
ncbi:TPA: glycosyltransferase family 4 protein [Serratia fonticola]|nr:glycosyltransferase family 4 protein [Serratia fonticola]